MTIERSIILSGMPAERGRRPSSGHKPPRGRCVRQDSGFTLVEVMIAMGILGLVLGGIYTAYQGQLRTFNTQEQMVDMQQNVRVARYFLERELRLAGLDPTGNAGAGITVANADTITFSMDFTGGESDTLDNDGDGLADAADINGAEWFNGSTADANEQVTYSISNDANADGMCDGLPMQLNNGSSCDLLRKAGVGAAQVVAANIDALNFVYLGVIPGSTTCKDDCLLGVSGPVILSDIRSVQIALIARSGDTVRTLTTDYTDSTTYSNQPPANQVILPAQNDAFRRIRLLTNVHCRNLGL